MSDAQREQLEAPMRVCSQFGKLDVLEHGHQVCQAFDTLKAALSTREVPDGWRIPAWLLEHGDLFLAKLPSAETLRMYQLYHDCGKPFCREVDAEGRAHFPGHAAISERRWLEVGGGTHVGRLIGLDMAFHLAKAEDMDCLKTKPEAPALLLTAIAEVHANAPMFGGFASSSFLAKAKNLDRRGKHVLTYLLAQ